MASFFQDVYRGARTLRRTPAFTLLAVAMLGLGLGASTTMFSVVNALWLKPLPYGAADRLVVIEEGVPRLAAIGPRLPVNAGDADRWRAQSRTLDGLTLFQSGGSALLIADNTSSTVGQEYVSADFFSVLGVRPQLGRVFAPDDDTPGHDDVVILSDGLWRRAFGADPGIVGRRVRIGARSLDVVGVLEADMGTPRPSQVQTLSFGTDGGVDLWRPLIIAPGMRQARMSEFDYACIGRLRPGVTVAAAREDLEAIEQTIASEAGGGAGLHAVVTPLGLQASAPARDAVVMMSAAVGVVLIIVCANLSNAFLARATGRQKELAIQAALGAGRGRLVRESLAESLLVSVAGAAIGLGVAAWALHTVMAAAPLSLPDWRVPAIDLRVLAFAALGTLALTALLAALPAWRSGTADPQDALRSSDRGATEGQRGRAIRRMLVSAEVALSTAGLVVAALLVSSFIRLTSVDAGFARNGGFVIAMNLGGSAVPDTPAGIIVARDVMARVAALPGVTSVGVVNRLPLSGEGSNLGAFFDGVPAADRLVVDYRTVSDGYFAAMGIPLISGRLISNRDGERPVGLVSADTAARIFPNQSPIGHRFRLGSPTSTPVEIVGVVGDVRGVSLTKAPNLTVYLPFWQTYRPGLALAVRTSGDPAPAIAPTRQILQQALPDRPAPSIQRLDELVPATVVARRFQLNVVAVFALVGLVLAAMGVYTVIAQTMAKRTRELGIRIALGAARTDVWRLVAREGLTPVTIGLACGLLAAAAVARFVQTMLFGMTAYDWPSYAGVAGLMIVTAVAACAWPARRASRIDPLTALREL